MQSLRTSTPGVKQVWLAYDSAGGGQIVPLYNWYNHLSQEGQKYGYLGNGSKSWLTVKSHALADEAKRVFGDKGQYYNWRLAPLRDRHRISRVQRSVLSGKGPWMERRTQGTIWDSKEPASCSLNCFHDGLQVQVYLFHEHNRVVWRLRWPYPRGDRRLTSPNTIRSNGAPP